METLTVKGEALLKVRPDTTRFSISMELKEKDYAALMKKADRELKKITGAITDCGFKDDDIKTENVNVSPVYESVRDEKGEYRQVFSGYSYMQRMYVSFDLDNVLLSRLVSEIYSTDTLLDIDISFTLKDTRKWEDELIKKAVEDATRKAEVIAGSTGSVLGGIGYIRYNMADSSFADMGRVTFSRAKNSVMEEALDLAYSPTDIELRDNIEICWDLIGKKGNIV